MAGPRPICLLGAVVAACMVLPVSSAFAGPGAKIGPVDCDAGGSVVTLTNTAGGPARFVLLRDDVVVDTVVMPAGGATVRAVVPIAEGAAAQVTARYGGSFTSGYVRRGCAPQPAGAATPVPVSTGAAPTSYASMPVVPATGTRATTDASSARPTPERTSRATATDAGSTWPTIAFLALAVIALAAAARLISRGTVSSDEEPLQDRNRVHGR